MLNNFEQHLYKKVFPVKPPKIIYHYTTQKGMLGIISMREMWATQVHFLNDKNEVNLTFKLLDRELKKRIGRTKCPVNKNILVEIRRSLQKINQWHICIASFCEEGDLLSQWRGYGNQGKGYAIGFNLDKLTRIAKNQAFVLWPCVYNPILQSELVDYLIESWCSDFFDSKVKHEDMMTIVHTGVCQLAPILKDESFSEEKEWRLVSPVLSDRSPLFAFREGAYSLIPYLNFKIIDSQGKDCIERTTVGPSPHMGLARSSLASFFLSCRLPTVDIVESKIPFRNWK